MVLLNKLVKQMF